MQNEDIAFLSRVDENGDTATCLSARKLRHNIWPMEDDLFHHKSLESRILKKGGLEGGTYTPGHQNLSSQWGVMLTQQQTCSQVYRVAA